MQNTGYTDHERGNIDVKLHITLLYACVICCVRGSLLVWYNCIIYRCLWHCYL